MKLLPTLFLTVFLMPDAMARRMGEAEVRTGKNDLPCFTIAEREERGGSPDFQSVLVTGGGQVMWRMAMPPQRTFPLAFSMCIPYGGRVQALPQTPAGPLASGVVYTVRIEARPGRNAATPLHYGARFCLLPRPGGGSAVRRIGLDERPASGCRGH